MLLYCTTLDNRTVQQQLVSDRLRFHGRELADVSYYKARHGWNSCCCAVEARLTPHSCCFVRTQLIWGEAGLLSSKKQHVGHGVWLTALTTDLSASPLADSLCGSLYWSGGLAHWQMGYSPAENTRQAVMLKWATRDQSIQINKIPMQPHPSGSVLFGQITTAAAASLCTYSTVTHIYIQYTNSTLLLTFKPSAPTILKHIQILQLDLNWESVKMFPHLMSGYDKKSNPYHPVLFFSS